MSDDRLERRRKKRGSGHVDRAVEVQRQAQLYADMTKAEQPVLFEIEKGAPALPDDDKPAGPGRPVGARATAPQEYRRYILSTKGDFLARFAGLANVDTLALARVLGCSPIEALQIQRDLGKVAAPYVYQQQPRALELDGEGDYFAAMVFAAGAAAAIRDGKPAAPQGLFEAAAALAGRPPDMQEIQSLKPVEFAGSEPAHSEPDAAEDEEAP